MQQVKIYTPGFFKGEAREQFFSDVGKMANAGWHVHTITSEETHPGKGRYDRLRVLYDTNMRARSEIGIQDKVRVTPSRSYPDSEALKAHQYTRETSLSDLLTKGGTQ